MTGDEIIAPILRAGMSFLPFAVSPHGRIGSLMRSFLYGVDPLPSPDFTDGRIHAVAADRLARSYKVPHGLLKRADILWRRRRLDELYGDSYKAMMTPSQYFDQKLGLVILTAVSAHLLRAHNRVRPLGPVRCVDPSLVVFDASHFPRLSSMFPWFGFRGFCT